MRTNQTFACPAIADAAFLRVRSLSFAAIEPMSLKRPSKTIVRVRSQTDISALTDGAGKERSRPDFATFSANIGTRFMYDRASGATTQSQWLGGPLWLDRRNEFPLVRIQRFKGQRIDALSSIFLLRF